MLEHTKLWETALNEIELAVSKANFNTWFKDTFIIKEEDGVVISKKTLKGSVGRHALKRKIMLALEKVGLPQAHMIFFVQKKAVIATQGEIESEYQKCKEMIEKMVE